MSATTHAPVLITPKPSHRRSGAPHGSVSARLAGALDGRDRARVEAMVASWCEAAPLARDTSLAHLDLTDVTRLEPAGLDVLNDAYARLNAAGWKFRVTPPLDLEPRLAFNGAAIQRRLLWA